MVVGVGGLQLRPLMLLLQWSLVRLLAVETQYSLLPPTPTPSSQRCTRMHACMQQRAAPVQHLQGGSLRPISDRRDICSQLAG